MDKEHTIKLAGSAAALAKMLGITAAAVSQWKKIPQARIWQLMLLRPEWFKS
jgi:hypothetical protein